MAQRVNHLRRIRIWLAIFMAGLILSGITAFPLQTETQWLVIFLRDGSMRQFADATHLLPWVERVDRRFQLQMQNIRFSPTELTGLLSLTW